MRAAVREPFTSAGLREEAGRGRLEAVCRPGALCLKILWVYLLPLRLMNVKIFDATRPHNSLGLQTFGTGFSFQCIIMCS